MTNDPNQQITEPTPRLNDPEWNAHLNVAGLAMLGFVFSKLKDRLIAFGFFKSGVPAFFDFYLTFFVLISVLLVLNTKHPSKNPKSFVRRTAVLYWIGFISLFAYVFSFYREVLAH